MTDELSYKLLPVSVQEKIFNLVLKIIKNEQRDFNVKNAVNKHYKSVSEIMAVHPYKMKKALTKMYKDFIENIEDSEWRHEDSRVVNQWKRGNEYGEHETFVFLVNAKEKEEVKSLFINHNVDYEPLHIYSDYDCTGKWFSNGMSIKKVGLNRWLCVKSYSRDV